MRKRACADRALSLPNWNVAFSSMAKMGGSAHLGRGMALSPMEGSSQRIPDIGRSAAYADSFKDSARYRPPMASLSESAIWPHRTEAATRPHCGRQSGKKGLMRTVLARFARICRAYTSSQWFCNIFSYKEIEQMGCYHTFSPVGPSSATNL